MIDFQDASPAQSKGEVEGRQSGRSARVYSRRVWVWGRLGRAATPLSFRPPPAPQLRLTLWGVNSGRVSPAKVSFVSTPTLNSGPECCPPWGLDSAGLVAVMDGAHRDPGQCWRVCTAAVPAAPPPGLTGSGREALGVQPPRPPRKPGPTAADTSDPALLTWTRAPRREGTCDPQSPGRPGLPAAHPHSRAPCVQDSLKSNKPAIFLQSRALIHPC